MYLFQVRVAAWGASFSDADKFWDSWWYAMLVREHPGFRPLDIFYVLSRLPQVNLPGCINGAEVLVHSEVSASNFCVDILEIEDIEKLQNCLTECDNVTVAANSYKTYDYASGDKSKGLQVIAADETDVRHHSYCYSFSSVVECLFRWVTTLRLFLGKKRRPTTVRR
ncbi:hypothetical protein ACFWFU_23400 [Streptomyces sp. NPDC060235]|uniref:hypothetical protein n=1 Tax=Streptomyces sp. NPDC060235 TaxID=3347080 RepID=UPI00364F8C86